MKKGWEYKTFKDISHSISDGDWIEKKDQSNSGIRLIQTGNIGVGKFIPKDDSRKFITEDTFKRLKCSEIFEGDVLISRLPNPLGRSCILPKLDTRCITAVDCSIVRLKKEVILSEYFIYYTQSQGYFTKIDSESSGTTRARITRKKLEQTEIPIPPLSEQKEIVEYLDSSFAKIDKLKENAAKNLEEAKALFQSALKDALEPKEGWEEKTLKDVCTHIVDCPHSTPPKSSVPTEFPFIRTSDLKQGKISWDVMQYVSKEEYIKRNARITPQKDDIIYGREGTFGDAVLLPDYPYFCLGQRVVLLRPDKNIFNPQFMLYLVISPFVYSQAKDKNMGCGVGHVNVADIKKFRLSFPPLSEQQSIVSHLDSLNEKLNTLQQNYSRICNECDALKQAILRQVFE